MSKPKRWKSKRTSEDVIAISSSLDNIKLGEITDMSFENLPNTATPIKGFLISRK